MELIQQFIDFFLHLDAHLGEFIADYGLWTYLILFAIIFAETGLVVTPFLPGDSLIFAAATLSVTTELNPILIFVLLTAAGILGDTVNYQIGHYIGPRVFKEDVRFLKREYLDKTNAFYEKHGGKTIIFARFVPIIRTFAPFVAGVGAMTYKKFVSFNVIGAILWVGLFTLAGYFFGNIPFIKDNFTYTIMGIILVSILPAVYEFLKERKASKKESAE